MFGDCVQCPEVGQPPEQQYHAEQGIHYHELGQLPDPPTVPWPTWTPDVITNLGPWGQFAALGGIAWLTWYLLLAGGLKMFTRRRRKNPCFKMNPKKSWQLMTERQLAKSMREEGYQSPHAGPYSRRKSKRRKAKKNPGIDLSKKSLKEVEKLYQKDAITREEVLAYIKLWNASSHLTRAKLQGDNIINYS